MKQIYKYLFPALTTLMIFNTPIMAEYIFLKDGSIITGRIESETPVAVSIIKNDSTRQLVNHNNIMRVLYTELYMGRVYVQQTNGKGLEVFMVDEDQEYYTFRHDLYKPEEIKIKRTNVLFMARKNPSGLEAVKVETDRIEISWLPPYNQIKTYKVYYKSKSADKFIFAGDTSSKNFTIKNLKSNKQYFIIVTAVDKENYKSLPSNEIKETTKNIRPNAPKKIQIKRIFDKAKKNMTAKISWQVATDPDGIVTGYNLYKKESRNNSLLASTQKPEFELKNLDPKKVENYFIRSLDDKKAESKNSSLFSTSDWSTFKIGFQMISIIPLFNFGNIHKIGFGFLINFEWQNVFFNNFNIGLSVGYWELQGKTNSVSSVDYLMMVPFLATINYRIIPVFFLSIIPHIAFGYSINYVSYRVEPQIYSGYTALEKVNKTKIAFEPLIIPGLKIQWEISRKVYFNIAGDFGMIIETGGLITFTNVSIEAGIRF